MNLTFWGQGPNAGEAKLKQRRSGRSVTSALPSQKEQQGKSKWPAALMEGGALTGPAG